MLLLFLFKKIITPETPILILSRNEHLSKDKTNDSFGVTLDKYQGMFYYSKGKEYIFKSETINSFDGYPYTLMNEILGYYISKYMEKDSAEYVIASYHNEYGVASPNFRDKIYHYQHFSELGLTGIELYTKTLNNLDVLEKRFNSDSKLFSDIFATFAIDFYMLQKDRVNINLQFKTNIKTKETSLGPLYDYSNCVGYPESRLLEDMLEIRNPIMNLNLSNLEALLKKYPVFRQKLEKLKDLDFSILWDSIIDNYKFNPFSQTFQEIEEFYFEKDEKQKVNIKNLL